MSTLLSFFSTGLYSSYQKKQHFQNIEKGLNVKENSLLGTGWIILLPSEANLNSWIPPLLPPIKPQNFRAISGFVLFHHSSSAVMARLL
jgi:hypothetical protein